MTREVGRIGELMVTVLLFDALRETGTLSEVEDPASVYVLSLIAIVVEVGYLEK